MKMPDSEPLPESFSRRNRSGIIGQVERASCHFLILGIAPAPRNFAERSLRLPYYFDEVAFVVGRIIIPEDVYSAVGFAGSQKPVELLTHNLVGSKSALAHNRIHIAVDEFHGREAFFSSS